MHRTQMKGVLVDGGYRGNMVTFKGLKSHLVYRPKPHDSPLWKLPKRLSIVPYL